VQSILSSLNNEEEMQWAYLISKNQEKEIDHGILRLINSFPYSRKDKNGIFYIALETIYELLDEELCAEENLIHFANAPNVPKALVKLLIDEKENTEIINVRLALVSILVTLDNSEIDIQIVNRSLVTCGICEAVVHFMEIPTIDEDKIHSAIQIINYIIDFESISRFITAGLLEALMHVCYSPIFEKLDHASHTALVKRLKIFQQFYDLGFP
jgi:hypothetical protein